MDRIDYQEKWEQIVEKGFSNYEILSENERIWFNIEPIINEGLLDHYINYGAENNNDLVNDLKILNEPEIINLIKEFNKNFKDGNVPVDIDVRNTQLMNFEEGINEKLDEDYWELNDNLENKLLRHIAKNF